MRDSLTLNPHNTKLRILAATLNRNKLAELATVAADFGIEIVSPQLLSQERSLGPAPDVVETGSTYRDNALLKARAFYEWSGGFDSLGDDSGLEVAALGNRPGVQSRRYAGPQATDEDRIAKILSELANTETRSGVINRRAAFCCSLVLIRGDGSIWTDESRLEGTVLAEARGSNGFGYDPIIHLDLLGRTLAEVDFAVTCRQGFRAAAARQLFSRL